MWIHARGRKFFELSSEKNLSSTSTSSLLFLPSISTVWFGSFGVTERRESLTSRLLLKSGILEVVPKAGSKQVAKGRRPTGRGAVQVRVRHWVDFGRLVSCLLQRVS